MTTNQTTQNNRQQTIVFLVIVGVIAILAAIALIVVMTNNTNASAAGVDYSEIPQFRLTSEGLIPTVNNGEPVANEVYPETGGFVLGEPDAPIAVVIFEDFLCPHCQDYKPVLNRFIEEFVVTGAARLEFRLLPAVDPVFSPFSAQLAECSDMIQPGTFWTAHDELFALASSERFTANTGRKFAERIGISYTELFDCTQSGDASQVVQDQAYGRQLGVTGTPTVLVRIGNAEPRMSQFGQQPTYEQLAILVASAGVQ